MAHDNPDPDPQDPNVEEPGDTDAPDIVGPTGEEMPRQSHDGLNDDERTERAPQQDENPHLNEST